MRKYLYGGSILLAVCFCAAMVLAAGMTMEHKDPLTVAPDHYKVLLDNDKVRVLDFHGKAGDKVAEHWHPDHVVYVIAGGKAKFTVDGKVSEMDMKNGDAVFMPAQNHAAEVIGPGEVHVVIVELKSHAH